MTTAITGISGFIGGNLARALLAEGRTVRGLIHHDRRAVEGLDVELVTGDLHNMDSLKQVFKGVEVVYHLAATISLDLDWSQMESNNIFGTRNVVEACLACGVKRMVHCSSIHAFKQVPLDKPLDEARALALSPHNPPYDRSKAVAELEVQKGMVKGLDAVIVNPTAIIGPLDFKPSFVGKAILMMAKGKLPALVKGSFDWVDVRDVVSGMIQAEQSAPSGAKYLLSGHPHSVVDLARMVADITGVHPPRLVAPIWLAKLGLPVTNLYAKVTKSERLYTRFSLDTLQSNPNISHSLATRDLGYQPSPFERTISDTVQWFRENGYLSD